MVIIVTMMMMVMMMIGRQVYSDDCNSLNIDENYNIDADDYDDDSDDYGSNDDDDGDDSNIDVGETIQCTIKIRFNHTFKI